MPHPLADNLLVVCLCAAWCTTCIEFQATLERIAPTLPGVAFAWLDIEDDSALIGEVEIENFPTLAVFRGDVPLFFGVTMPQEGVVARTLASLGQQDREGIEVPAEIARLPEALRERLAGGKRG